MAQFNDFPFWELRFTDDAKPADPASLDAFIEGVKAKGIKNLFIFSHGWNNDPDTARDLYRRFFSQVATLVDTSRPSGQGIGLAGVIWPSIKWPDRDTDDEPLGGAASAGGFAAAVPVSNDVLFAELAKVFTLPEQQATLAELKALLDAKPNDEAALQQFKAGIDRLVQQGETDTANPDSLETAGLAGGDYEEVFDALADGEESEASQGGAAGFGNPFKRLWSGAKGALRVATYAQMKKRGGEVGKKGLGPLLGRLKTAVPDIRIHLLGHSFGARLVAFSLAGIPEEALTPSSPVKSLFLMQGAFSHFAFAGALPFDKQRGGALKGMASRVDGPLLTTFSEHDMAVGTGYPLASIAYRDDAAAAGDATYRWQAMGHDGAQSVDAVTVPLGPAGTAYAMQPGKWVNLDGNQVIKVGGPPSGAHSDIIYPHTAWACLSAAGLTG
jgi:hypothetical protein